MLKHRRACTLLFLSAITLTLSGQEQGRNEGASPALRIGDRATLIGGTFVERLQLFGYFESELLAAIPDLTIRNLGWSGDNVYGEARAVFGKVEQGYQRLMTDLKRTKPTVVVVAYGNNEAHQGEAGLPAFEKGLARLLDDIGALNARIVLCLPHRYEKRPAPLPDPSEYNAKLQAYRALLKQVARKRGLVTVDLDRIFATDQNLTDNGVHLTEAGEFRCAPQLSELFGGQRAQWEARVQLKGSGAEGVGTRVSKPSTSDGVVSFKVTDLRIGRAPLARSLGEKKSKLVKGKLFVEGLPKGTYGLHVAGKAHVSATSEQWAKGVELKADPQRPATLRQLVLKKNELYFHRYRPQNETYLFLFRKHEQGNNAVEIPQFEPLVSEQEKQIAKTRATTSLEFELRPVKSRR